MKFIKILIVALLLGFYSASHVHQTSLFSGLLTQSQSSFTGKDFCPNLVGKQSYCTEESFQSFINELRYVLDSFRPDLLSDSSITYLIDLLQPVLSSPSCDESTLSSTDSSCNKDLQTLVTLAGQISSNASSLLSSAAAYYHNFASVVGAAGCAVCETGSISNAITVDTDVASTLLTAKASFLGTVTSSSPVIGGLLHTSLGTSPVLSAGMEGLKKLWNPILNRLIKVIQNTTLYINSSCYFKQFILAVNPAALEYPIPSCQSSEVFILQNATSKDTSAVTSQSYNRFFSLLSSEISEDNTKPLTADYIYQRYPPIAVTNSFYLTAFKSAYQNSFSSFTSLTNNATGFCGSQKADSQCDSISQGMFTNTLKMNIKQILADKSTINTYLELSKSLSECSSLSKSTYPICSLDIKNDAADVNQILKYIINTYNILQPYVHAMSTVEVAAYCSLCADSGFDIMNLQVDDKTFNKTLAATKNLINDLQTIKTHLTADMAKNSQASYFKSSNLDPISSLLAALLKPDSSVFNSFLVALETGQFYTTSSLALFHSQITGSNTVPLNTIANPNVHFYGYPAPSTFLDFYNNNTLKGLAPAISVPSGMIIYLSTAPTDFASSGRLSGGKIAAAVICSILGAILITVLVWWFMRPRKSGLTTDSQIDDLELAPEAYRQNGADEDEEDPALPSQSETNKHPDDCVEDTDYDPQNEHSAHSS